MSKQNARSHRHRYGRMDSFKSFLMRHIIALNCFAPATAPRAADHSAHWHLHTCSRWLLFSECRALGAPRYGTKDTAQTCAKKAANSTTRYISCRQHDHHVPLLLAGGCSLASPCPWLGPPVFHYSHRASSAISWYLRQRQATPVRHTNPMGGFGMTRCLTLLPVSGSASSKACMSWVIMLVEIEIRI